MTEDSKFSTEQCTGTFIPGRFYVKVRRGLSFAGSVALSKSFERIGKISPLAFGDAAFEMRLAGFRQCHTDHRFRVVLNNFQIGCRILPVTACIKDVRK